MKEKIDFKKINVWLFLGYFFILFCLFGIFIYIQEKEYISSATLTTGYLNRTKEISYLMDVKRKVLEEKKYPATNIFINSYPSKNTIVIETISFHPVLSRDLTKKMIDNYINYSSEIKWSRLMRTLNDSDYTIEKRRNELRNLTKKIQDIEKKNLTKNLTIEEKRYYERLLNDTETKLNNIDILEKKKKEKIEKTQEDINQIKILAKPEIPNRYSIKKIILWLFLSAVGSSIISYYITLFLTKKKKSR